MTPRCERRLSLTLVLVAALQQVRRRPQLRQLHASQLLPPVSRHGGTIDALQHLLPQLPLPQPAGCIELIDGSPS